MLGGGRGRDCYGVSLWICLARCCNLLPLVFQLLTSVVCRLLPAHQYPANKRDEVSLPKSVEKSRQFLDAPPTPASILSSCPCHALPEFSRRAKRRAPHESAVVDLTVPARISHVWNILVDSRHSIFVAWYIYVPHFELFVFWIGSSYSLRARRRRVKLHV